VVKRLGRQHRVGVQKEQKGSAGMPGAKIHLVCALPSRAHQKASGLLPCYFESAIHAPSVNHDNLLLSLAIRD
jgi:hypothetical protein